MCIDRVTGLAELIRIQETTSMHVTAKFEECWLTRYPRPMSCCHDNGGKFTGWEFQQCLSDFGIKDVSTTSRNPTGNAICERMHRTVGDVLRTLVHENQPRTLKHAQILIDRARRVPMLCAPTSPKSLVVHQENWPSIESCFRCPFGGRPARDTRQAAARRGCQSAAYQRQTRFVRLSARATSPEKTSRVDETGRALGWAVPHHAHSRQW